MQSSTSRLLAPVLLRLEAKPAEGKVIEPLLPEDERLSTFRTNVIAPVSTLDVEHYLEAAERVAAEAVRDVGALVDCDRAALGDAECAARFIARTGRLAHRGPLAAGEQSAYEALFARHAPDGFAAAISAVIEAMLQSPAFLYQLELPGASDPAGAPSQFAWSNPTDACSTVTASFAVDVS